MPNSPGSDRQPDTARPVDEAPAPDLYREAEPAPELAAELTAVRAELDRTRDRYRRALADLDNYRKRTERGGDRRAAEARLAVLREWLDAVDSVQRALRVLPDDQGMLAVLEQMNAILGRHGVVRLDRVGARFDPARDEAIAVVPAEGVADHTVLEVTRAGYATSDGAILRTAQVVVARHPGERHPEERHPEERHPAGGH
jgi:molecular chaperone GrpE